jgi:integrase
VHADAVLARLEKELFPKLGATPITAIEPPDVLDAVRAVERRGALKWASKTLIAAGQVFRYAVATGRAKSDPTRDLRGALKKRETNHYARLREEDLPEFLAKLEAYEGKKLTQLALKLLVLTWVRTAELRGARWTEFNFDKAEWRVPAERMKGGKEHIVPLSRQAVEALEELRAITGNREYLFPNEHDPRRPMSENTILYALYRMGYRGRATGHGFRGTASTIMNEQGWNKDWIERQLAHVEGNKVRAAYNHAEYLAERRGMLQAWADYLSGIRAGATVLPIRRAAPVAA